MARLLYTLVFSTLVYLAAAIPNATIPDIHIPTRLPSSGLKKRDSTVGTDGADFLTWTPPYTYYAAAAYCKPETIINWTCGANCEANWYFQPSVTGGDGVDIPYWFVGYDPALNNVMVGHQGTDPETMMSYLEDTEMTTLNSTLFPPDKFSSSVKVHKKLAADHARTIVPIYIAVVNEIVKHMDSHPSVTLLGHSKGAALALLDAVFMVSHLPDWVFLQTILYGIPRIGNQAFADYVEVNLNWVSNNGYWRINNKKDPIPVNPSMSLGYVNPGLEEHIMENNEWEWCLGPDNPSPYCSVGAVKTNSDGVLSDSYGPYDGVTIGC
ncbi:alpha/beta-hydrolase [Schizopora paradoxa]|uniref:Alpha/beta-hydrolase n=1 Tax=Schizopora paradoxa TaxID=27342 RepID=A0A0H2R1V4_9AGAM|nr:alpha/beta-hydrolase [Schizopora paradoxa]